MAFEFEQPNLDHKVTSIFGHTKNRPGQPSSPITVKVDEGLHYGIRKFVEGRYDPRVCTLSDFVRDAIYCHLEAVYEALCLEETPFGMYVRTLELDEQLAQIARETARNEEFVETLRQQLDIARVNSDTAKIYELRMVAYQRVNRTENKTFQNSIDRLFPNGD